MANFNVTARIMLELGSELISSDIIAFFELIKNGFDAGTKNGVEISFRVVLGQSVYFKLIRLLDTEGTKFEQARKSIKLALNIGSNELYSNGLKLLDTTKDIEELRVALKEIYASNQIIVSDTGAGMSLAALTDVFLVVGTASRKNDVDAAILKGDGAAPYLGEKGIGRLSAMRLGMRLSVITTRAEDTSLNRLDINWKDFDRSDVGLDAIVVKPYVWGDKPQEIVSGTQIVISDLTSNWTQGRLGEMAKAEFSILTDPMLPRLKRKKVKLLWNGEKVIIPVLDKGFLKHAHASVEGSFTVGENGPSLTYTQYIKDLGFPHPPGAEKTTFNVQDILSVVLGKDSNHDVTALENIGPFTFEAHWFNRRRLAGIEGVGNRDAIRELHTQWNGIRLYRDSFRVFPYGSEDDDWLELDRKALRSRGYTLNKTQFIGQVNIDRVSNPFLVDQTNREGLRESSEQASLLGILQFVIQDDLRVAMARMESKHKKPRIEVTETEEFIQDHEKRAKSAIQKLRKAARPEDLETIDQLNETIITVSELAKRARAKIEEVEADSRKMIDMAGIGLLVEMVAHELARISENALDNLKVLRASKDIPDDVKSGLESLQASMKSLNKRLSVLDPLSVTGRQRSEKFSLTELIKDTLDGHKAQFLRHNVEIVINEIPAKEVRVKVVKGMVVQVFENLLSNSLYWLALEKQRVPSFDPKIIITLSENPLLLTVEDNGPGIDPSLSERIFELFYSLKDRKRRRGMGLFIARDCAEHNGGGLTLDKNHISDTGRLNRFLYHINEKG